MQNKVSTVNDTHAHISFRYSIKLSVGVKSLAATQLIASLELSAHGVRAPDSMSVYVLQFWIASQAQYEPMVIPCCDDLIGFTSRISSLPGRLDISGKRGDLESGAQITHLDKFQGREELESGVQIAHLDKFLGRDGSAERGEGFQDNLVNEEYFSLETRSTIVRLCGDKWSLSWEQGGRGCDLRCTDLSWADRLPPCSHLPPRSYWPCTASDRGK